MLRCSTVLESALFKFHEVWNQCHEVILLTHSVTALDRESGYRQYGRVLMGDYQSQAPANFLDISQSQLDILAIPANNAVNGLFRDTYNLKGG